jgi:hypothetical protein
MRCGWLLNLDRNAASRQRKNSLRPLLGLRRHRQRFAMYKKYYLKTNTYIYIVATIESSKTNPPAPALVVLPDCR